MLVLSARIPRVQSPPFVNVRRINEKKVVRRIIE
jgi:hypothetical protein